MTQKQIEQKKAEDQLVEAGAWPLDEDDLDQAAGGTPFFGSKDSRIDPKAPL